MSGIQMALLGSVGAGAPLVSYTLTTGATGSAGFRYRGYDDGSFSGTAIGTLAPSTTFTLNGGTVIEALIYDENALLYSLQVNGGTNSGWTSMDIGGLLTLTRASATYSFSIGNSYWQWGTSDTIATQVFGIAGATRAITFY